MSADPIARLREGLLQQRLIVKPPTQDGLRGLCEPPRAIMVGLGLRSRHGMTRGVPLDVVGLLLSAREVRDSFGPLPIVAVLGDAQAEQTGVRSVEVATWVKRWLAALRQLSAALDLGPLHVVRSFELARDPVHRQAAAMMRHALPDEASAYCVLQSADTLTLQRRYGALIKVGWAMSRTRAWRHFDETGFDYPLLEGALTPAETRRLGFVYTGPGRAFSDARPRCVPYVVTEPDARLLLEPDEDVAAKIAHARTRTQAATWRGAVRHLKGIARMYSQQVRPLRGDLAAQLRALLDDVFAASPTDALHPIARRS